MDKEFKKEVLAELQIPEEVYDELVADFLKAAHAQVTELKQALDAGDIERSRFILHTLKGTAANLRLKPIENTVDALRWHIKSNDIAQAKENVVFLANEIAAVEREQK